MQRGIRLFKVIDITISLDYSWFIVFFIFSWSLAYGYFPYEIPGLEKSTYLMMGAFSSIMLFVCVLIHELSHSYVSNKLGLVVKEITLFIFGGMAHLTEEPHDAMTELKIAIAGPVASAVLAGIFFLLSRIVEQLIPAEFVTPALPAILDFLLMINLMLLIFNLIPGLPLDGGRVLRALWWKKTGNIESATKAASSAGTAFAFFLIFMGLLQTLTGNYAGGLWAVLIGVFLRQAAIGSYNQIIAQKRLSAITIGEIMSTDLETIESRVTVNEAIEDYFFTHNFTGFPVMEGGRLIGLLTLKEVRAIEKAFREITTVKEAMEPITSSSTIGPDETALEATARMTRDERGRYPVVKDGLLVGMISRKDIMRVLQVKAALNME